MTVQQVSREAIDEQIELRRVGQRGNVMHGGTLCSRCLVLPPKPKQRYCAMCHAAYERERRARNKAALANITAGLTMGAK